jgi:hypothetical protein
MKARMKRTRGTYQFQSNWASCQNSIFDPGYGEPERRMLRSQNLLHYFGNSLPCDRDAVDGKQGVPNH